VRGTAEVSRGNYDYKIRAGKGEELTFLAQKFEEMSRSLKEKVHQLAEQNTELEKALQRLKETQQELVKSERLAATGRLTAQLSHEINNPVHNIQSCLQTVLKRLPHALPERELLDVAYEEVERLARLTQQLLQVYRTSMIQETRVPVCLNDLIREVLSVSSESFRQSKITVDTNLEASLPSILGSPDKLKQVFLNLFINAKDAMPRGGRLSAETVRANGNIVVSISDTGVGIPRENIHRIFDAFFTTKSRVSGVGLGLAVTYGIIKQHEGTITVKSKPGEGTLFTITFPAGTETDGSL
jgi:signal transduction histidine kinase